MAKVQENDLLMDDLAVAEFLEDDGTDIDILTEQMAGGANETETTEDWVENINELPGQLAVDIYETDTKLMVKARIAGVSRQDLEVTISDQILTVSGIFNSNEEVDVLRYHTQECYWGEFSRTITLPVQVQEGLVDAVLKDGVLTISFEKIEQKKAKVVNVIKG
ncbi:Hsp20/alpha crystallin family protein [Candidatus Saccharibacteria bacterium]|nr:Hsp20/alpha crystallin family protein [Candidatus Saccharibacteria bacterium]